MRFKKTVQWAVFFLLLLIGFKVIYKYFRVVVEVDGETYKNYAFEKKTVAQWLDVFSMSVSSLDIVEPPAAQLLRRGQSIRLTRVRQEFDQKQEVVNFTLNWKRRLGRNLRLIELQNGYRQTTTLTLKHIFHDGKEVAEEILDRQVKREPVERVALLNRRGYAEKIYDLSKMPRMKMTATAYWLGDPKVPGDTTFSGHKVRRGLVAVDPRVLPLRSRLYIPGYGYAYSSDTGSAIKGKRVDLFVDGKADSRAFEFNKVTVYVLEKSRHW